MPLFFLIFLTLTALFHLYSYRRFIRRCQICQKYRRYFLYLLILNYFGVLGYVAARLFDLGPALYFLGSLSVGLMFIFFVSTLLYDLIHLVAFAVPMDSKRRDFFKKSSDYGIFAFAALYTGESINQNLQDPILKLVNLNQNLLEKQIRIVQISDLHITEVMEEAFVEQIVKRINDLNADLIAITGDLVDAKASRIAPALEWLEKLHSKAGTYFVTGNHEYYVNTKEILGTLEKMHIKIMDNKGHYIESLGINLVGVPDFEARRFAKADNEIYAMDIPKAVQEIRPDTPTLLLAHQPKTVKHLEDFKPHLTLSGHTHGGQLFPFNYLVRLQQPYVKDLHRFDENSYIYVSSGTGFWGPPMRLGAPSEITVIEWS